jgi:hypothetical protein
MDIVNSVKKETACDGGLVEDQGKEPVWSLEVDLFPE